MKIVERAEIFPGECLYTNSADGPFIDLEREYTNMHGPGSHQYMKLSFAKEIGRMAGLVEPDDGAYIRELEDEVFSLQQELTELRDLKAALNYHLDGAIKGKPGRRPKETSNAS